MVLELLLIGVGITLDPLPIMAFVLLLASQRGVWKGLVFILAWLACLVTVIALVLLFTGGTPPPPRSPPSTGALAAKLAIGIGLVAYGMHRRRRRGAAHEQPSTAGTKTAGTTAAGTTAAGPAAAGPAAAGSAATDSSPEAEVSKMDRMSLWSAAGLAVFLQPWGVVAAGATVVVKADLSHFATYLALFGFCILATASLLAAELYTVLAPKAAGERLKRLRAWLEAHEEPAIIIGSLVLGLWLTGNSIYQLTS
ncbi:GAP family protein [Streptomyces sp. FIT100]|uniref:GAP family protein n=1 Tax=Streptomyces sp. FIT100 TaxID=2837956 RepID=UPI0021C62797|nr:GAP family protein [Streptomyces sp. FIT100]UUN30135.1 GAP family protein [Streptomyces sp. FIT100]